MINFQYINECVKLNKTAEYLVIDNPSLLERANSNNSAGKIPSSYTSNNTTLDSNASSEINLSSLGSFQKAKSGGKYNLRNIAVYNPTLNNYTGDIMNPSMVLEKGINFGMNDKPGASNNNYSQNNYDTRTRKSNAFTGTRRSNQNIGLSENTIEEFINLLNNEVEKELENQLKNGDIIQTKKEEEKKDKNKLNEEKTTYRKSQVLRLNDENSLYLKKKKLKTIKKIVRRKYKKIRR